MAADVHSGMSIPGQANVKAKEIGHAASLSERELLTCENKLLTCENEILTGGNGFLTGRNGFLTGGNRFLT